MKKLFVRAGLMCDFEDVRVGWQGARCIAGIGAAVALWASLIMSARWHVLASLLCLN